MLNNDQWQAIADEFDNLSELQQEAVLDLVDDCIMHGELNEDELMHYGVLGMKWGRRKSQRLTSKKDRVTKKNQKLSAKAGKLESKAVKFEAKNSKKMYKLQKKEYKYDITGNDAKLKEVQRKMKKLNIKAAKARYKAADIKLKIQKSEKLLAKLNSKIDTALAKESEQDKEKKKK